MCISLQIDINMALLVLCGVHVAENEKLKGPFMRHRIFYLVIDRIVAENTYCRQPRGCVSATF